jgi:hypothetical protein
LGPPVKVRKDTEFTVSLKRDARGLGIEVDNVSGKAVIGAVTPKGAAAKQTPMRPGDIIVKVFEYETPTYDGAISGIKGASGQLEMTMLRKPITVIMSDTLSMMLGGKRDWRDVKLELSSNRELKAETVGSGTSYSTVIPMREALEVTLVDSPNGGTSMSIVTPAVTYELRSKDGVMLHRWERRLTANFHQLGVTVRKEGWLQKKGDQASLKSMAKRWCILDSHHRLYYFKDPDSEREQGMIDLSVANGISEIKGGLGFEIATPGRAWVFHAEDKATQSDWMAALLAMLNDQKEIKAEQQAGLGFSILKGSEAGMRDDRTGDWLAHCWWELNSTGLLTITDREDGQEVVKVNLEHVERVDRTKGQEYHQNCIDLDIELPEEEFTLTMKPNGRTEMQSWLGILKEQVALHAKRETETGVGSLSIVHTGWVTLKRADIGKTLGKKFALLVTEQKEVAEAMTVTHTLYWFESEEASRDLACGSALDLEEVEEIEDGDIARSVRLVTESGWQLDLNLDSQTAVDTWKASFRQTCVNVEGYEAPEDEAMGLGGEMSVKDHDGPKVVHRDAFKIAVQTEAGGATHWHGFDCELLATGFFTYSLSDKSKRDEVGPAWVSGKVDMSKAIGVWLLGQSGFKHLDIILPGNKKYMLTADKDQALDKWKKSLFDLLPHKPVQEMARGWMEKKGEGVSTWKSRLFVLLSTRELLYFENDTSTKRKGQIDLKFATKIELIPDEYDNYEYAFQIVTGKRNWILCPEGRVQQKFWIDALNPMIAGEGHGEDTEDYTEPSFLSEETPRGRRVSMSHNGPARRGSFVMDEVVMHAGWLEKCEEEAGEDGSTVWQRRFFRLLKTSKSGATTVVLEYFLDENLAEDEDSDTVAISSETALTAQAEGEREHCLAIANCIVSAESEANLQEWKKVLQAVISGVKVPPKPGLPPPQASSASLKGSFSTKGRVTSIGSDSGLARQDSFASMKGEDGKALRPTSDRLHAGYMVKKGEGFMSSSQKRWFVLYSEGKLFYYEDEGESSMKGAITLNGVKGSDIKRTNPKSASDFAFSIKTAKRKWQLAAGSEADWEAWEEQLLQLVESL